MRIYLDAAPVIFLVEQVSPFDKTIEARLSSPGIIPVVSDLTRMECRIKPLRGGDAKLLQDFDDYFGSQLVEVLQLSSAIIDKATEIRLYSDSRRLMPFISRRLLFLVATHS